MLCLCWRHSNRVNTGSSLPNIQRHGTKKMESDRNWDMIRNDRIDSISTLIAMSNMYVNKTKFMVLFKKKLNETMTTHI